MKNEEDQIHLRNMLSCIHEIENYCVDLDSDQLNNDEKRMQVFRNLAMLGMEARRVSIQHATIKTLKSFANADYINGLGRDVYAVANFIFNDLSFIKQSVVSISEKLQAKMQKHYSMA